MSALKRLHLLQGILVVLLLLSGISLFITPIRTWFHMWHFPIVAFHIGIALLYTVTIVVHLKKIAAYTSHQARIKKFNVSLNLLFFVCWLSSGLVMYYQQFFSYPIRNFAVFLHDICTFAFLPWVLIHGIGHMLNIRIAWPNWWRGKAPLPPALAENRMNRKDFLIFSGTFLLSLAVGGSLKWLTPKLEVTTQKQSRRGYFRIYNVTNNLPDYASNEWTLTIDGLVNRSVQLTYQDMYRFVWTDFTTNFHCVTGWSVINVNMRGILVKDLFDKMGIVPTGNYFTAYSGDQVYVESFTVEQLLQEEAYLIFEIDGKPLTRDQGFPCRLYFPQMYGYKSVKWIERLTSTRERVQGYWQIHGGYDTDGYL